MDVPPASVSVHTAADEFASCNVVLIANDIQNIRKEMDALVYLMEIVVPSLLMLPDHVVGEELKGRLQAVMDKSLDFRMYHIIERIKRSIKFGNTMGLISKANKAVTGVLFQLGNIALTFNPITGPAVLGAKLVMGIGYFIYSTRRESVEQARLRETILTIARKLTDEWVESVEYATELAQTEYKKHCSENPALDSVCGTRLKILEDVAGMKTVFLQQVQQLLNGRDPVTNAELTLPGIFAAISTIQPQMYSVLSSLYIVASPFSEEELNQMAAEVAAQPDVKAEEDAAALEPQVIADLMQLDAQEKQALEQGTAAFAPEEDPASLPPLPPQAGGGILDLLRASAQSVGRFIGNKLLHRTKYVTATYDYICTLESFIQKYRSNTASVNCTYDEVVPAGNMDEASKQRVNDPNFERQIDIAVTLTRLFALIRIRFASCGINQRLVKNKVEAEYGPTLKEKVKGAWGKLFHRKKYVGNLTKAELEVAEKEGDKVRTEPTVGTTCEYYMKRIRREMEHLSNMISELICMWKFDLEKMPIFSLPLNDPQAPAALDIARKYLIELETVFNPSFNDLEQTGEQDILERNLLVNLKFMEFCGKITIIDFLLQFAQYTQQNFRPIMRRRRQQSQRRRRTRSQKRSSKRRSSKRRASKLKLKR